MKHFGTIRNVFHELVSPDIHCDIDVVDPPDQAKVYLITGGMSGYLMPVPDELQADGVPERLELMVTLPAEWPLTYKDLRNKANYWPIQMLKDLARYPVENFQMLNNGHTVGMPKPYGDTKFTAALLRTPGQLSPKTRFRFSAEVETGLLQLIPILPEEREYLAILISRFYPKFPEMRDDIIRSVTIEHLSYEVDITVVMLHDFRDSPIMSVVASASSSKEELLPAYVISFKDDCLRDK